MESKKTDKISSTLHTVLTEDEIAEHFGEESKEISALLKLYSQRLHRNSAEVDKQLTGRYNLNNAKIRYFKSFFPSAATRRSWLYLQSLFEVSFGAEYYTVREGLASYLLLQTTAGEGKLLYAGKEYALTDGDVFFIDCQQPHDYRTNGENGWTYRLAHFNGASMPDYFAKVMLSGRVVYHFTKDSEFHRLLTHLYDINRADTLECELLSNCILTQLLTEIISHIPQYNLDTYPQRVLDICEYLTQHCCENLSLDVLTELFGISKYHMSREFRRVTGQTIFGFIEDARIGVAKQLLRYSDLSIVSIAEYVGYSDQSNFGRAFRKAEGGLSPTAFRKQWSGL